MIIFENIKWKNFLSTGNVYTKPIVEDEVSVEEDFSSGEEETFEEPELKESKRKNKQINESKNKKRFTNSKQRYKR